jgi:hypothetical protein
MYGYVDKFYNIFKRNNYLQTNKDVYKYVDNLQKKHVTTQFNVVFSLLTIEERNNFIASLAPLQEPF